MNGNLFNKLCQVKTLLYAWKLVKQKGTAGGIDGKTIADIDADIGNCIRQLQQELVLREWNPEPYLRISIPKKNNERRQLGLFSIKDKIVQQAIKQLIEPRFEKVFVKNSFGYRLDKGHMFTEAQLSSIQREIGTLIVTKEDTVIYYPCCMNCFSKIIYQPCRRIAGNVVLVK